MKEPRSLLQCVRRRLFGPSRDDLIRWMDEGEPVAIVDAPGVCAVCLGRGWQPKYTTAPQAVGTLATSGHLAIAPACEACKGTGKGTWR